MLQLSTSKQHISMFLNLNIITQRETSRWLYIMRSKLKQQSLLRIRLQRLLS